MPRIFFSILMLLTIISCSKKPTGVFSNYTPPTIVDYSKAKNWAALPTKKDSADLTPHSSLLDLQKDATVDVFFLHPTIYTRQKGNDQWNASVDDAALNVKVDAGTIRNQASIFNGAGKVYAPRYRQAHIQAYYTKDKASAKAALDLAYEDVKAAFQYFLKQYNHGRPIIIAAHSQGTTHATRLMKDFFDGQPLQQQLVAAYLVGMPVPKDYFKNIKVCETPKETGCFCSWRTFKEGGFPKKHQVNNNIAVTNPLTWTTDKTPALKSMNEGSVLRKFQKGFVKNLVGARIHDGLLWTEKPKFPGSFLLMTKNYHIADFNFFYVNVRNNAILRTEQFKILN